MTPRELDTPPEIAVETHFHAPHGTKTTPVFLPADRKAARSLLPSWACFLSGGTVQPKSTYSSILKMTGQVLQCQKG